MTNFFFGISGSILGTEIDRTPSLKLALILSPSNIGERGITDEQGEIFEETLGKVILELIEDSARNDENRNNNTKEFVTE